MRVILLTAIHGRHKLAEAMLRHHAAMRGALGKKGIDLVLCVAASADDMAMDGPCSELGVPLGFIQNEPVNEKWNFGLCLARALDPDAVLRMDSDDFATQVYIEEAVKRLKPGSGLGPDSVWLFNLATGQAVVWPEEKLWIPAPPGSDEAWEMPIGAGRLWSRELLDKMEWRLWPKEVNSGLNTESSMHLSRHGHKLDIVRMAEIPGAAIIDVKTEVNIHPWDEFRFTHVLDSRAARSRLASYGFDIERLVA